MVPTLLVERRQSKSGRFEPRRLRYCTPRPPVGPTRRGELLLIVLACLAVAPRRLVLLLVIEMGFFTLITPNDEYGRRLILGPV